MYIETCIRCEVFRGAAGQFGAQGEHSFWSPPNKGRVHFGAPLTGGGGQNATPPQPLGQVVLRAIALSAPPKLRLCS